MANYTQPDAVEQRVRFFDGQFLQDQDFIDEQKYHLDRERRLSRVLRVSGVVEGLGVSTPKTNQVAVAAGTAIDGAGRQLVLASALTLDLPAATFNNQQGIRLCIIYDETAVEPATTGSLSERRWLERPKIVAITLDGKATEPWDEKLVPVLLAQLRLDGNGQVTIDSSAAQYAGLRLPGSLGVGTTDPAGYRLKVQGGNTYLDGTLTVGDATMLGGGLTVSGATSLNGNVTVASGATLTANGATNLSALTVSGATSLNGNVTVASGATLTASGSTNLSALTVSGATNLSALTVSGATSLNGNVTVASGATLTANGATNLSALTVSGTGVSSFAGNVGIGTTSPGAGLEIAKGTTNDLALKLRSSGPGWGSGMMFTNTAPGAKTYGLYAGADGNWHFADVDGGIDRLLIDQWGRVGIGTSAPFCALDVAGAIRASGIIHAIGNVYCEGFIVIKRGEDQRWRRHNGFGWEETVGPWQMVPRSDVRLKKNVQTLSQALEKVLGLRGVIFNWNNLGLQRLTRFVETYDAGPGATEQETLQLQATERAEAYARLERAEIGMIAQEVQRVAPELVSEDEDGYLGVAYERIVALLIEAIKEQHTMIEALSDKIAAMPVA